jgi:hypothetical protein
MNFVMLRSPHSLELRFQMSLDTYVYKYNWTEAHTVYSDPSRVGPWIAPIKDRSDSRGWTDRSLSGRKRTWFHRSVPESSLPTLPSAQNEDLLRSRSIETNTAACLYTAGREEGRWLTQSEAAAVANASTVTVRAHRDTLEEQVA